MTKDEAIAELRAQAELSRGLAMEHPWYSHRRADGLGEARAYRDAVRVVQEIDA